MSGPVMVEVDPAAVSPDHAYKLLVGAVVPRPVAWVTTLAPQGHVNLAPFSCFTFVCSEPPMIAISVGRLGGELKDTPRNIAAHGEFVAHIADEGQVEQVHESSTEFPREVSEVNHLGLEVAPSRKVKVPRLAAAPVAMECRLERTIDFGLERTRLIVGEVVHFHIAENLYKDGRIDALRFRPVARLGGPRYARLGEIVQLKPVHVTPKS
jgi:flavin reductase (DIM6/NTAB) family NADH-FMN oxidoreductase RutF